MATFRAWFVFKFNSHGKCRMTRPRTGSLCMATGCAIFLLLAGVNPAVYAAFHLWNVKEVFSNADGSVQFVEMFDNSFGETSVNGFKLRSNSDGVIKEF